MDNDEEWGPVEGWPYEVSNLGRVRRTTAERGTSVGRIMRPFLSNVGYWRVWLSRGGKRQRFTVHSLVAGAFLGARPEGFTVNHKNGDKADPRAVNLEWTSRRDNQLHAYATGLQGRGEKHGRAKLKEDDVREIRRRYEETGVSQTTLAKEYGVNQTLIGFIVRRAIWTHLQ